MAQPGQRKVLLCIDGSDTAKKAFQFYLDNIKQERDYCYGVMVTECDIGSLTAGGFDALSISKSFTEKYKETEKLTADYTAMLRNAHVKGQCDAYSGSKPGEVICQTADMLNVDQIVIGTRGLGKIKRAILGSVSQFVILNSGRPVTVVPMVG